LLDLWEVGAAAVYHHASATGRLDRASDTAAKAGVLQVTEMIDHQDVIWAKELDDVMKKRRILPRPSDRMSRLKRS
jgi:hypothetical protein